MENYVKREIDKYGTVSYINSKGQYHRLDGPAREWPDGSKVWWINDKIHRLDGPAIIFTEQDKHWYLNYKIYPKSRHNRLVLFFVLESRRIVLGPTEE
jgi:hypothetical protein